MFFHLLFASSFSAFVDTRQISGDIKSEWNKTSVAAEALSFLQDVDHSLYWDFLEQLSTKKSVPESPSDAVEALNEYLEKEQTLLLNFSLLIHYYSPRVENSRQRGESMKSHIRCKNAIITDLSQLLGPCESEFYPYEPVYGRGAKKYILYADLDSYDWKPLYTVLQNNDESVSFVVRAYGHSSERMVLSGYGMQMKPFKYSMEFSVSDTGNKIKADSKLIKSASFDDVELPLNLSNTKKAHKSKISNQIIKFLKGSKDPFAAFTQLTQNYPLFVPELRNIKINDEDTQKTQRMAQHIGSGATALFVNGRKISGVDLNAFSIYESLLEEYTVRLTLKRSFDLNDESLETYAKAGHNPKPPAIPIVDARSNDFVYWMNDLEKDPKYAELPPSLLAFVSDSDTFPSVSKNVANVIFLLDPADPDDMQTIAILDDMIEYKFPARMGYIICQKRQTGQAKKIYYAYAHLAQKYGPQIAHKFLLKVNDMRSVDDKTRNRGPIKPKFWKDAFSSVATQRSSPSFDKMSDFYKSGSFETRYLERLQKHIKRIGISAPAAILNGHFIEEAHPELFLRSFLNEQLLLIRTMMGNGLLTDSTVDYHDTILKYRHAMPRYNPIIQRTVGDFSETINIEQETLQNQRIFSKWIQEIKYSSGSSYSIKNQTHWVFINKDDSAQIQTEVDLFANDISNKESCRIAVFKKGSMPPQVIQRIIGIPDNKVTVVFNGRVVRFNPDSFSRFDLQLLEMYEASQSSEFSSKFMKLSSNSRSLGQSRTHREISDSLLYMTIVVADVAHRGMVHTGNPINSFEVGPTNVFNKFNQDFELTAMLIIDPISFEGQKMASLIPILKQFSFGMMINPPTKLSLSKLEPLTSFYRFVLDQKYEFTHLNSSTTYSLVDDLPPTWQVWREVSCFDMDNVLVDDLAPGVHVVSLSLRSILIEGFEYNAQGKVVPGVELTLFDKQNRRIDETRVIQKNGYWQLNAIPGEYSVTTNTGLRFIVIHDSFLPKFIFIESKSIIAYANKTTKDDGKIHCFYVASGALYERLMRISFLSVLKHTQSPVKFWIFENFVSPQYRKSLSSLAAKYNFEYQFCSYHWPRWMPQETARQRLFWGYKILFLDVMFPNDLQRVIYVDSDQIIRSDLRELMTMSFKGAPYAFTPFCSDRPEMADYRFWEKGYWVNLLNGKPYHISALFAIDLSEFRSQEVGDKLRHAYHDLANDKGSLSNLDQDLPNMLQNQAPIFSLPQEWLWCGSWCSDETMSKAKTIDLCNNPRTKVGKLEYAKEHIPEWTVYDEEINPKIQLSNEEL